MKAACGSFGPARIGAGLAAAALLSLSVAACGTTSPASTSMLATSASTPQGTWAVVPMGLPSDPLNTFWQLFFRPVGAARWIDRAASLGVATNGGIVMAPSPAPRSSFTVSVLPANLLNFSPVLTQDAAQASWIPETPLPALASDPDVLAVDRPGTSYAVTRGGDGALMSSTGLTTWRTVTSATALRASAAGRACGIQTLTSVGEIAGHVVLGAACTHEGVVGIFTRSGSGWVEDRPTRAAVGTGEVRVLGLVVDNVGLCAVLAVTHADDTSVVLAQAGASGRQWRLSPPLRLGGAHVTSIGPDGERGLFVLATELSGALALDVTAGPRSPWIMLPEPPEGTATVAVGQGDTTDALVAADTLFSDWVLTPGSRHWTRAQVTKVAIEFGSST